MDDFPFIKQIYYRSTGVIFGLTHWTDMKRVLGIRLTTFIKLTIFVFFITALIGRWGAWWITNIVATFLIIQYSYWRSRKRGYYRFVSSPKPQKHNLGPPLKRNKRIPILATGIYSVLDYEKNLLLFPGKYWQVPLGQHGVIIKHKPGKFLYQFFNSDTIEDIRCGWILFGYNPVPALAITFLSTWGPEFHEVRYDILGRTKDKPVQKIREIYLSFTSKSDEIAVLDNLIHDIRNTTGDDGR